MPPNYPRRAPSHSRCLTSQCTGLCFETPTPPCHSPTFCWPPPARLLPTTLAASPPFANSCMKLVGRKRNHTHNTFIPPHLACWYQLLPFLVFTTRSYLGSIKQTASLASHLHSSLPKRKHIQHQFKTNTNTTEVPLYELFSCTHLQSRSHPSTHSPQHCSPSSLLLSSSTRLLPLSHMFKQDWKSGKRWNLRYFCCKSIYSVLSHSPNKMGPPAPLSTWLCQLAPSLPFTVLLGGTTSSLSEGKFTSISKNFLLPASFYAEINEWISHSGFLHPPLKTSLTLWYSSARTVHEDSLGPPWARFYMLIPLTFHNSLSL